MKGEALHVEDLIRFVSLEEVVEMLSGKLNYEIGKDGILFLGESDVKYEGNFAEFKNFFQNFYSARTD